MTVWSNRLIIIISAIGLFIAGVLSYASATNMIPPCGGQLGCFMVQTSPFAKFQGISVSYIGLAGYVLLFALAIARSSVTGSLFRALSTIGLLGAGVGLIFSVYLTYQSITVLHVTCIWCLASLGTIFALTILHGALLQDEEPAAIDVKPGLLTGAVAFALVVGGVFLQSRFFEKAINMSVSDIQFGKVSLKDILPAESKIVGDKDAKVVLVEFADINCPSCRAAYKQTKEVVEKYNGRVKLAFCHYPLIDKQGHETSLNAAVIAEMAAKNGMFWKYMDYVMEERNTERIRTIDGLLAVAGEAGVSRAEILRTLTPQSAGETKAFEELLKNVARDMDLGKALEITATPTYLLYAEGLSPKALSSRDLQASLEDPLVKRLILGS